MLLRLYKQASNEAPSARRTLFKSEIYESTSAFDQGSTVYLGIVFILCLWKYDSSSFAQGGALSISAWDLSLRSLDIESFSIHFPDD
jgi:hypothetical protein